LRGFEILQDDIEYGAAAVIQATWRGVACRARLAAEEEAEEEAFILAESERILAAEDIQRTLRGHWARRRVTDRRDALRKAEQEQVLQQQQQQLQQQQQQQDAQLRARAAEQVREREEQEAEKSAAAEREFVAREREQARLAEEAKARAAAVVAPPPALSAASGARLALATLTVKQLRLRAVAAGADVDDIEEARDSEDPKGALVELLMAAETSPPAPAKPPKPSAAAAAAAATVAHRLLLPAVEIATQPITAEERTAQQEDFLAQIRRQALNPGPPHSVVGPRAAGRSDLHELDSEEEDLIEYDRHRRAYNRTSKYDSLWEVRVIALTLLIRFDRYDPPPGPMPPSLEVLNRTTSDGINWPQV
jgi:hypothetical protein